MNITDLARVRDEDLVREPVGQASGAGARALMDSIMSEKREPVRPASPGGAASGSVRWRSRWPPP